MTRVLPVPAPAKMRIGPSTASTASRCWGFRLLRISIYPTKSLLVRPCGEGILAERIRVSKPDAKLFSTGTASTESQKVSASRDRDQFQRKTEASDHSLKQDRAPRRARPGSDHNARRCRSRRSRASWHEEEANPCSGQPHARPQRNPPTVCCEGCAVRLCAEWGIGVLDPLAASPKRDRPRLRAKADRAAGGIRPGAL